MVALSAAVEAVQLAAKVAVSVDLEDVPEEVDEAVVEEVDEAVVEEDALDELETPSWATVTLPLTQV